jgi:DNA mismatch repair protein MutS
MDKPSSPLDKTCNPKGKSSGPLDSKPIFDQYVYYYDLYKQQYEKLVIIMQCGEFYEIYGVDNDKTKICNIKEILTVLPLNLQDVQKENYNTSENPLKAGFRKQAKSKYLSFLIEKGYTVVQVDEVGQLIKGKRREVTCVHSPGTYINEEDELETTDNYIVQIIAEGYKDPVYKPIIIGMSALNITTGTLNYYEVANSVEDENYAVDEIARYLSVHQAKEVLIYQENCQLDIVGNKVDLQLKKPGELSAFYEKYLQPDTNLDKYILARQSLLNLLYYVLQHNKILVQHLKHPVEWFSEKYLFLANNAISQLDLINQDHTKFGSVFNIVNFTQTPIGKRLLKHRLLNPIKNTDKINARLDLVQLALDNKVWKIELNIADIDKLHRKLEMGIASPKLLSTLIKSYQQIVNIFDKIPKDFYNKKFKNKFIQFVNFLTDSVNISVCSQFENISGINNNIFTESYQPGLQKLGRVISRSQAKIQNIMETISACIPTTKAWEKSNIEPEYKKPMVTLTYDKNIWYFEITKARLKILKQVIAAYNKDIQIKQIGQNMNGNYIYITTPELEKASQDLTGASAQLSEEIQPIYINFLAELEKEWSDTYKEAALFIGNVDFYSSAAKCAHTFKYCKPTVLNKDYPYIKACNMRHPIVEQICKSIYVPHSMYIGKRGIQGALIFGQNGVGKTIAMKSLGINLIMAQAGLFVSAESFTFTPYNTVMTRILGNDDMHKGMSSFAVEMSELKSILCKLGPKTLVLGDELCRGTENISGAAICAAAILEMMKTKTSFVFATHLHSLTEIPEIKELHGLGIYHLQVTSKGRKIVYDRQLKDGQGDTYYGIEIASAMGLDSKFIGLANKIRKDILDDHGPLGKTCQYNAAMFLEKCGVCGDNAEEVHHIKFQEDADENGFIGHFHKNHLRNLCGLCKACHHKLHLGKIMINGWKETIGKFYLDYQINK